MRCIDCGSIIVGGTRCFNCSRAHFKKKVIHDTHKINFGEFRSNWDNTKVREHNLTKIIKSLEEGSKSHNKLCKDSNIGRSSIRKCIDQLIREGIVTETECGSKKMVQLISEYDARGEIQAVVV